MSVHFRTYIEPDGTFAPAGKHRRLPQSYYISAMNRFARNVDFLLFADNVDLARAHYADLLRLFPRARFVGNAQEGGTRPVQEGQDVLELAMMAACHDNIIANSSFSWWAAYLNPTADKVVIAPKQWFGPLGPQDTDDLCPPCWARI